jgi:hypothetical protein
MADEEQVVAELAALGVSYLSRQSNSPGDNARPPAQLLADLMQQPNARVREAVIALLLSHPEYAEFVPAALRDLAPGQQLTLKIFYTAAVWLQQEHMQHLMPLVGPRWHLLPDLFSVEFGLRSGLPPTERLAWLGRMQRRKTGVAANWVGTYENVARKLVRSWEIQPQWNR